MSSFTARCAAFLCLLVSLPVWVLIAVAILIDDGCPALFRQKRVGLNGKPFTLLKFRSMKMNRTGTSITASNDDRITRVGRVLRKFKLDEIPQLWNVARGDMIFIGPRPEVPVYVNMEDPTWREVLSVKPGITDLATLYYCDEEAILGGVSEPERYYLTTVLPDKLKLNLAYQKRRTFDSDLRVLALTLRLSLARSEVDRGRLLENILGGGTN